VITTSGADASVKVWNLTTSNLIRSFDGHKNENSPIKTLTALFSGSYNASGSDKSVQINKITEGF